MPDAAVLHGFFRSGASYRVRIALNLKGVAYRDVFHNLRKGEQNAADYRPSIRRASCPRSRSTAQRLPRDS